MFISTSLLYISYPTQTGLFAHCITGGRGGGVAPPPPPIVNSLIFNHVTLNFPQYFFDLSLIRIRKKKSKWRNIFDDTIICAIVVFWTKNVFWSKIYFGAFTNSLILNHLTSNFPQYFFDRSLIRIRKKKSKWRNFFNDVMT